MEIAVLIPAYNPNSNLLNLINRLVKSGFDSIIVVDDGSEMYESKKIFDDIQNKTQCHVLRHAVNLGKGRALKTGFNFFCLNFEKFIGVVTCDCDGQHTVDDILKISKELNKYKNGSFILGCRDFNNSSVPIRSRLGNVITKHVFKILIGKEIQDTQTGLRGISTDIIPSLINVEGERYEYETNVLINTSFDSINVIEKKISTVYIDDNKSSHFNPIKDSFKIYFVLLRFAISSFITSIFDFVTFIITYKLSNNLFTSVFIARFLASIINFNVNKKAVFHKNKLYISNVVKYYLLLLSMAITSYTFINYFTKVIGINVAISKVIIEVILFCVSFSIQRDFVFSNKKEEV